MDRKVLFQAILWSMAVYFLLMVVLGRIYPPEPPAKSPTTQPAGQVTTQPGPEAPPAGPTDEVASQPAEGVQPRAPALNALAAVGAQEEVSLTLGSVEGGEQSPYRAQVTLSNVGASIESIRLSDYRQEVDGEERYRLVSPVRPDSGTLRSLTLKQMLIDGVALPLDGVLWRAGRQDQGGVQEAVFRCDVLRDQAPILRLQQRYALKPAPIASRRYDLESELTFENLSPQPLEVRVTLDGPTGIQMADRRTDDRRMNVGIFLDGAVRPRHATPFADVSKNTQALTLFDSQDEGRFWWVATEDKYFAFITAPVDENGGEGPGWVFKTSAIDLDGRVETADDVVTRLVLGALKVPPQGEGPVTVRMQHYIGPKDKRVFNDEGNADYRRRNYYLLNQDASPTCTFAWLTELMVTLLNAFYAVVHNYGIAIFLLVLLVRIILHPVTKKTQVNMVKMQQSMGKLQPKIEEIKQRYANDKQRMQQETMRAYKEAGVNPAGSMLSCLPMVLQMPIWVALYWSLNNNIAMRHEGFVLWIKDLTAPDALIPFGDSFHVPLLDFVMGPVSAFNLLPILVGVTMYAQQKLMPKPKPPSTPAAKGQSDQAAQMQKQMQAMMPFMSVFMALIFYNMPSGLNLYIMTSSVLGAVEQWRIRKHVEATQASRDERPSPLPPRRDASPSKPRVPAFLERLARKADDAQKLRRKSR